MMTDNTTSTQDMATQNQTNNHSVTLWSTISESNTGVIFETTTDYWIQTTEASLQTFSTEEFQQMTVFNCSEYNSSMHNLADGNSTMNRWYFDSFNGTSPNCTNGTINAPFDQNAHIRALLSSYDLFWVAVNLQTYKYYFLPALAFVGNLLSFLVIRKRIRKSSSCFYMAMLAIFDTTVMMSKTFGLTMDQYDQTWFITEAGCRINNFIMSFAAYMSVWTVLAMTCERCIAVAFPFKASSICTVKNAVIVTISLSVLSIILNFHYFFFAHAVYTAGNAWTCMWRAPDKQFLAAYTWVDTTVYSFIPLIMLYVLNGIIISLTSAAARKKAEMTNNSEKDVEARKQQNQITRMLITVSASFTFFMSPYAAFVIAENFWDYMGDPTMYRFVQYIFFSTMAYFFVDMNHSINFLLYFASGKRFRRDFVNMWPCCRKKSTAASSRGTSTSMVSTSEATNASIAANKF